MLKNDLMTKNGLFQSFLMGGFECSTHRRGDGKRLDLIAGTRHDEFARQDYERLINIGMLTVRDGVRWHLIEKTPYEYDFSSVVGQVRAARETGTQVIWDLFHYGYPDDLDITGDEFVKRFAALAGKFTEFLIGEKVETPYLCLVNEISFFAWAVGEVGWWFPKFRHRGGELKRQLVKASIAAARTVKSIAPNAVLIQTDPIINVIPRGVKPQNVFDALNYHNSQYEALDMILGKTEPELGGFPNIIDAVGVNFYPTNQWRHPGGRRVLRGDRDYKPFSLMLEEFHAHCKIPLFVAETGTEDDKRANWFRYICDEVKIAIERGVPVLGICLYPVVNHPGWDDDRHCKNGLWDYPNDAGEREIYEPLAVEIRRANDFAEKFSASE
jgi:beta-glucosidase/6-phospho-beta-glucosidase/beta-galactosidase